MGRNKKPEQVVLLHGITLSSAFMSSIGSFLESEGGYKITNVDYASTKHSLPELAEQVADEISGHMGRGKPPLHFVGHSMGGTLAYEVIAKYKPENARSLVMLGSPNQGSEWADLMKSNLLLNTVYQWFFGPAGQQLSSDREKPKTLDHAKVGIIAGSQSFVPWVGGWVIGNQPHDGLVSVDHVKFPGAEHIVVPADHFSMLIDPKVKRLILNKLRHGQFEIEAPALEP
jgi:pimeloyl-ACP methyl ester carboxylesterase